MGGVFAAAALFLLVAVAASTSASRGGEAPAPQAAAQPPSTQPPSAQPAPTPGQYAGEATCLTCHTDQAYTGTAHARAFHERTPAARQGCESCHGPGKAHADAGGDKALIKSFKTLEPARASEACTTCHNRASHALWEGSQHDQRNISCISCHQVHGSKGQPQLAAETQTALCSKCHKNITNRQHRFNHMPVREGSLNCSSCHNVHGSTNVRLLRAGTTIDESCTSCHADKRGPYLWEHAPVSESCITCHDPHGSNNDRMLVSKQPFLCQRCHVTSRHPPTVYDGFLLQNSANGNKIYGRSCTICHQLVHGSNAPSGKALLR